MTDVRSADPAVAATPAPGAGPESGRAGRGAGLRAGAGAALPAVGLLIALAVWWLTARLELIHPAALPPPGEVLTAFVDKPVQMLGHTWDTMLEILYGFALSVAAGVLLGLSLASSRTVERMFTPLLVAVNAVPKITLGPLLVVAFGWGQTPILTMVFLLCFFPIVLSTATGLTTTCGGPGRTGAVLERVPLAGVPQGALPGRAAADLRRAQGGHAVGRDRRGDR